MKNGVAHSLERGIRVVVGEDSAFMRRMIVEALNGDPGIEVVGAGSNGREILKKVVELKPDCVTLDLEMPRMDGLETLRYIMSEWPTPVVILSAYTADGARITIKCLEYGAVDFVPKALKGKSFSPDELIAKVKLAAGVDPAKVRFAPPECDLKIKCMKAEEFKTDFVVIIGASTGGPQALMEVVPKLPKNLPACVIIVQHMPPDFTLYLAERLDSLSRMHVREAGRGELVTPGRVLVAPGGMHLFLEENLGKPTLMLLERNELQRTACPSIDFAMSSFAPVFGEKLIGVILTGMGRDGTAGSVSVHRNGGRIICQDSETSMIYGMPKSVMSEGKVDLVLPLERIAEGIVGSITGTRSEECTHEAQ
jgi:two-component system chemotaxis response regulator CheB